VRGPGDHSDRLDRPGDREKAAAEFLTEVAKAGLSQDLRKILGPFLYQQYEDLLQDGTYRQGE
jgi:hypothetical protein